MDRRTPWIAGLIVVVAGIAAWPLFVGRPEERARATARSEDPTGDARRSVADDPGALATPREPAPPAAATPPEPHPARDEPASGSELAADLDAVSASYLTDEPRVADLLALCQEMAAQAVVDPESLRIERDESGVRFARGELEIDGLRGTFLLEEGTYHVRVSSEQSQAPWGVRDVQITFPEELSPTAAAHVTVQFQPRTAEPASRYVAPGEERLVGWGVGISPATGAVARPLTVRAEGEAWQIGEGKGWRELELPWISGTRCFEAWLRLLQPCSGR